MPAKVEQAAILTQSLDINVLLPVKPEFIALLDR